MRCTESARVGVWPNGPSCALGGWRDPLALCAERAPSSDYLPQVFLEQWPHLHKHEKLLHLLTARSAGYARDFARLTRTRMDLRR